MLKPTHSRWLIVLVICLSFFGLLMVGNASVVSASRDFSDKWHYFKLQGMWTLIGLTGFFIASRFSHHRLVSLANQFFLATIVLLVLVLIPGIGSHLLGARRWIDLGFLSFQPAEIAKLSTAIYLSKLFTKQPRFTHLLVITGLLSLLIMLEPDMGTTTVIICMSFTVYFGSGGKIRNLIFSLPLLALVGVGLILIAPYRLSRLQTFINSSHDPQGASYQVRQAIIGIGSGGPFGLGLGQSRQKYQFLPEVTTDSIYAVIGEELGLVGTSTVLVIYLSLIMIGLQIAKSHPNRFSSNLALAISSWFGFQAFINISSIIALTPFTGIPLSFISYGGSSLVITLIASGILVNISHDRKK